MVQTKHAIYWYAADITIISVYNSRYQLKVHFDQKRSGIYSVSFKEKAVIDSPVNWSFKTIIYQTNQIALSHAFTNERETGSNSCNGFTFFKKYLDIWLWPPSLKACTTKKFECLPRRCQHMSKFTIH